MKTTINIREHLRKHASPAGDLLAHASVDLDDLFETNDIEEQAEVELDLHELLRQNRQIADLWSVQDVRSIRHDLNDEQAWAVLQQVERHLDSDHGITWDTLEQTAHDLFGCGNSHRVQRCEEALATYDEPELADLLADAMHWCQAKGHDFEAMLETARMHFDAETPNE